MKPRTFQDIFNSQRHSMFHTIDAFMFCPVIHKCPLDILHPGDQKHISHEQCQFHKGLHNRHRKLRCSHLTDQAGQRIGKQHKRSYRHNNRKSYRHIKQPLKLPVFFFFFCGTFFFCKMSILSGHFFIFLISCDLRRIHQTFGSHHKRIHEAYYSTDNRFLQKLTVSEYTLVIFHFQFDLSVRTAYPDGILILVTHHNAFHHCLSANIR